LDKVEEDATVLGLLLQEGGDNSFVCEEGGRRFWDV